MNTGPKTFINRLQSAGKIPNKVKILNPSLHELKTGLNFKNENPMGKIIARMDGALFYEASICNFYNFLVQRSYLKKKPIFEAKFDITIPYSSNIFNKYLNRVNRKLIHISDRVVFQSKLSTTMHKTFVGVLPDKYEIIMNGISIDDFTPNGDKQQFSGYPAILISASLYRPHKRLQSAINFVNYASRIYPNVKLHILGEPDPIVKSYISHMDMSRCVLHGRVPVVNLPTYYRSADVMLSLALFDPCPNVVTEALACGLPVITPLQSGASELIGGALTGLCVDEKLTLSYMKFQTISGIPEINFEQYINTLHRVLEHNIHYRNAVRDRVEDKLDIRKVFRAYEKVWSQ